MQRIDAIVKLDRLACINDQGVWVLDLVVGPEVHVISLQQEIVRLLVMF